MRRLVVAIAAAAVMLLAAAPAGAAIKVQAPPEQQFCGDGIAVGVRAPVGTKGSRVVRVKAVDGASNSTWFSRRTTARRHWKHWFLPSGRDGQCNPTTIVYSGHRADGSRWVKRYKILFRTERL